MKFHRDYVVVKTQALVKNESKFKGADGLPLLIATSYEPKKHAWIHGEVISVPQKLSSSIMFAMNAVGAPIYFNMNPNELIWLDQVPIILQPGDKVYYHPNTIKWALRGENLLKEEKKKDGSKEYWLKVRYDHIFCAVRDGKIIPNATWTMVKPDMEDWEDILHKVPELDKNGQPKFKTVKKFNQDTGLMEDVKETVWKPEDQWIQLKVAPEARYLKGWIKHIGVPLKCDPPLDMKQGDHIIYRHNADFEIEIENQKYFVIKQRHIEAIIEN